MTKLAKCRERNDAVSLDQYGSSGYCCETWVDAKYEYECDLPDSHPGNHHDLTRDQEWAK